MTEMIESPPPPAPDSSGVAVLDRAFALLAAFGPTDERLTMAELSRRTGLYKSTVLRLLAALEHGGFIRKLSDGQYAIGPAPLRLATIYRRSLQVGHVVEPLLKQLSVVTGETASFYVRQGEMRIAVYRAEPTRAVRAAVAVGQEYPIDRGASGKVLLAFTDQNLRDYDAVRRQYWAASYGERDPDTASIAAPVFDVNGTLQGALTLSGPRERLTPSAVMLNACGKLLEAAQDATQQLGGDGGRYADSLRQLTPGQFEI